MIMINENMQRIFHQFYIKLYKGEEISLAKVGWVFKESKFTIDNRKTKADDEWTYNNNRSLRGYKSYWPRWIASLLL